MHARFFSRAWGPGALSFRKGKSSLSLCLQVLLDESLKFLKVNRLELHSCSQERMHRFSHVRLPLDTTAAKNGRIRGDTNEVTVYTSTLWLRLLPSDTCRRKPSENGNTRICERFIVHVLDKPKTLNQNLRAFHRPCSRHCPSCSPNPRQHHQRMSNHMREVLAACATRGP